MRRRAKGVLLLGVLLCAAGAGAAYLSRRGQESTDDAQIEGRIVHVPARVGGVVQRVWVRDHQRVEAGELLVELDDRELRARVAAASADLHAAQAGLRGALAQSQLTRRGARAGVAQARGAINQALGGAEAAGAQEAQAQAELQLAEARLTQSQQDLQRALTLQRRGAAPAAELEQRQLAAEQARRQREQAEARLRGARASREGAAGAVEVAEGRLAAARTVRVQGEGAAALVAAAQARVEQAQAALGLAQVLASYAQVRAPVGGVVSRRGAEEGALVGPERPLIALAVTDELWAVAYFKEDQLARARAGQRAALRIDGYGDRVVAARVRALGAATGSRFALLPPDNASGNFIKVTQRVPVLLDFSAPADMTLRIGMSASATLYEEP